MAILRINEDLERVFKWLNANKLSLNLKKTKWMSFFPHRLSSRNVHNVCINGSIIERVHSMKYLGIIIDDKLNFNEQIDSVAKKSAMKINLLKRISKRLTFPTKKIVYNTIISPNFEYCSTLYLNCTKEKLSKLQLLQNRAMRIILKCDYRTHRIDMLNDLGWMSISQRIRYNTLVMIFKINHGLVPPYMHNNITLNSDIHSYNTRNRNNFRLPLPKTEQVKFNIFYYGLKMFNELPSQMKNIDSLNVFKKECAKYIKQTFEII